MATTTDPAGSEGGRNLIVLLDGTGNEIGKNLSNVLKFFRILVKDGQQLVYYDPGVGTVGQPSMWGRLKQKSRAVFGLMVGLGLDENVLDAYSWLCRAYREGDRVYLLGFSRGAYSARVLAGFIHLVGLLRPEQLNICGYALVAYKRSSERHDLSIGWTFKRVAASRRVTIRFLGVWDSVASVIAPRPDRLYLIPDLQFLPYTRENPSVEIFRQAAAIDERRRMFRLYRWKDGQEYQEDPFDKSTWKEQKSRQVWFAGVHSDVGGGYPEDESGLSKYPLLWMVEQAVEAGLRIRTRMLNHLVLGAERANERSRHDYVGPDHTAKVHTSLKNAWWLLEPIPKLAKWMEWRRPSLLGLYIPWAEPRPIPEGASIHQSVIDRMAALPTYRPPNLPARYDIEPHSARLHKPSA